MNLSMCIYSIVWSDAKLLSMWRLNSCVRWSTELNIDIDIFCLFFSPSVGFLRSILADRFRNKISAQVSVCTHANVLIRLASTIDEISFFKFFAFSFPFFLLLKEKDHPSRSLSLSPCLLESVALSHIFLLEWKREDNKTTFQSICCYRRMSLASARLYQESGRCGNDT